MQNEAMRAVGLIIFFVAFLVSKKMGFGQFQDLSVWKISMEKKVSNFVVCLQMLNMQIAFVLSLKSTL